MLKTAIVILNFNGKHFLEKFLPSVVQNSSQNAETMIFVADNASNDDSLLFLKERYPQIKTIILDKNYGFAEGYNLALERVKADFVPKYYVLLNSDVEVTSNWLAPLENLLENDTEIAACQPKILSYHQKTHFEYAGGAGGFLDRFGFAFCRGRIFDTLEEDKGQYNDTRQVFWATGACMFVRANVYHELGGLDGYFFAHQEEIDLCWRMQNNNKKVFYCAESTVFHVGGGTLHKSNPKKTYLNFRNNLILLHKNLPNTFSSFWVLHFRLNLDGLASINFLLKGQFRDFWAVLRAHYGYYHYLFFHKKTPIEKLNPQNKNTKLYPKSIVWAYFVKKIKKFSDL